MEAHAHSHAEAIDLNPASWTDTKRYAWLLGLVVPLLPFIAWAWVELTGLGLFWFFGPILVFVIFPLLDIAVGMDAENPPDSIIKWLEQDRYYRWCTYAFIPFQYAGLVFACWLWTEGGLSTVESIGLALTMGMVSGIAINTAHELGHKRASLEKWLSKVAGLPGSSRSAAISSTSKLRSTVSRSACRLPSSRPSRRRWVGKIVRPGSLRLQRNISTHWCSPSPPTSCAYTRAVS